jgi:hypothetical protein
MLHNALCSEERQVDLEQKPRERSFIRELVPDWRPTREQTLWSIRIILVLVVVLSMLTLIGLPFGVTLWEWVKLLIVPAVIAAGGIWFNRQQRERELKVECERTQDEALQAYLDKMTDLLVVHDLGQPQFDEDKLKEEPVRTVAWARTKTVLRRLDGNRKGAVLRFLTEADLITKGRPIIRSLSGADLVDANLKGSVLRETILQGVDLRNAVLKGANLRDADLGVSKRTQRATDLTGADLRGADLRGADLSCAKGVTNEQLAAQTKLLQGATMPNGQKYEDWLKSREVEGEGDDYQL